MLGRGKLVAEDSLQHPLPQDPADAPQLALQQVEQFRAQPRQKLSAVFVLFFSILSVCLMMMVVLILIKDLMME